MSDHRQAVSEGAAMLALCVIQQAMRDAIARPPDQQAVAFLTDTTGAWATAFDAWCGVADVQPDWARERCQMVMMQMISAGKTAKRVVA